MGVFNIWDVNRMRLFIVFLLIFSYGTVGYSDTQIGEADKHTKECFSFNSRTLYDYAIKACSTAIALIARSHDSQNITNRRKAALAYNGRGLAYREKDDYDKAIGDFTVAISFNPDFALAYNNRASAYLKIGNYNGAIIDLSKIIDGEVVSPVSPLTIILLAHCKRGFAYEANNRNELAKIDFAVAEAMTGKSCELLREYSMPSRTR